MRSKLCNQQPVPDNKVTTCVFHPIDPVLAVGFHDGSVVLIANETDDQLFLNWDRETLSAVHDHLPNAFGLINMEWNVRVSYIHYNVNFSFHFLFVSDIDKWNSASS